MADFEKAVAIVLVHEGGYVDNPYDHGGPTNMGITMKSLSDFTGSPCTDDDIKNLSTDTAKQIYFKNYWKPNNFDWIYSDTVATVLFDLSVLVGPQTAIKFIQDRAGAKQDGILGPHTAAIINERTFGQSLTLACDVVISAIRYFVSLCEKDSTQIEFIYGWLKRCEYLFDVALSEIH